MSFYTSSEDDNEDDVENGTERVECFQDFLTAMVDGLPRYSLLEKVSFSSNFLIIFLRVL